MRGVRRPGGARAGNGGLLVAGAVARGEPLFAVETAKATLDVEAPASGILGGVAAKPGDVVKVLSAIARIAAVGGPGSGA